ncbi:putative hemoglobin and hemoglobin-haptoglobin-binding protein 3 precursor, partial [Haemophilus influenzae]
MLYCICIKCKH